MTMRENKSQGEILLYQAPDGTVGLDVRLERETIWMSQKQMALLFDKDTDTIGLHIRNAYKEGELKESATTEDSSIVQNEGGRTVRRPIRFYNLDVVISVGYRVKSLRGTQIRIWATRVLRDHLLKGYSVNEKRLHDLSLWTATSASAPPSFSGFWKRTVPSGIERASLVFPPPHSWQLPCSWPRANRRRKRSLSAS